MCMSLVMFNALLTDRQAHVMPAKKGFCDYVSAQLT